MLLRSITCATLALVLLSGCGGDDGATAPETASTPASTPAATPAATPTGAAGVTLSGDGLITTVGGTAKPLPFGTPKPAFLAAVTAALGEGPAIEGENTDCPAGPVTVVQWNGLDATLQDDKFVGWTVQDGSLKTASGLGVDGARAEIQKRPGFSMPESTLGPEFSVDGVGGLFNGEGPDAGVELLFAGLTCFAR